MRKPRLTAVLGLLSVLSLTPSCNNHSSSNVAQIAALSAIMVWTNPAARYLLQRSVAFPHQIESIILRHTGTAGNVNYSLEDPTGNLKASPASGILKPGGQVVIAITCLALVYTAITLNLVCTYADVLGSTDRLSVPLTFALMPPALFVMATIASSDPALLNLFWATLIFGAIGVIVQHSSKGTLRNRIPLLKYTEIVLLGILPWVLTLAHLQANFWRNKNSQELVAEVNFPPGQGPYGYTLHANKETDMTAGTYYMVHLMMEQPIPLVDPIDQALGTYSFVFDSDGSTNNNWVASASFPNDFYKDTDRWYEINYSKANGWSLTVTQIGTNNSRTEVASAARAIIVEDVIVLVVPKTEIPGPNATWRATSFVHTGDFGMNPPYLWSGDVMPPVDKPLLPVK